MSNPLGMFIMIVIVFTVSRYGSCYPENGLIKKYVRIKNDLAVDVLIASSHGRDRKSDPEDQDKMCVIGVISYSYLILTIFPFLWGQLLQESIVVTRMCNMIFWINIPVTLFLTVLNDFDGFIYGTGSDRREYKHWIQKFMYIIATIFGFF